MSDGHDGAEGKTSRSDRAGAPSSSGATDRGAVAEPPVFVADEIAMAALRERAARVEELRCEACDELIDGEEHVQRGLLLWTRGDEVRLEGPPLCERCSAAVSLVAKKRWALDDEEEG